MLPATPANMPAGWQSPSGPARDKANQPTPHFLHRKSPPNEELQIADLAEANHFVIATHAGHDGVLIAPLCLRCLVRSRPAHFFLLRRHIAPSMAENCGHWTYPPQGDKIFT